MVCACVEVKESNMNGVFGQTCSVMPVDEDSPPFVVPDIKSPERATHPRRVDLDTRSLSQISVSRPALGETPGSYRYPRYVLYPSESPEPSPPLNTMSMLMVAFRLPVPAPCVAVTT